MLLTSAIQGECHDFYKKTKILQSPRSNTARVQPWYDCVIDCLIRDSLRFADNNKKAFYNFDLLFHK